MVLEYCSETLRGVGFGGGLGEDFSKNYKPKLFKPDSSEKLLSSELVEGQKFETDSRTE